MLGKCFYIVKINLSQEGDLPLTLSGSKEKSCWNHKKHFRAGRTLQWRVPRGKGFWTLPPLQSGFHLTPVTGAKSAHSPCAVSSRDAKASNSPVVRGWTVAQGWSTCLAFVRL